MHWRIQEDSSIISRAVWGVMVYAPHFGFFTKMWDLGDIYCLLTHIVFPRQLIPVHIVVQQLIVDRVKLLPCIYCRQRQYMPKFAAYIAEREKNIT